MEKLIELNQVSKTFSSGKESRTILDNVNLSIASGEFIVLKGENGAGKTTLLNLILGLQRVDSGDIKLFGQSPEDSSSKQKVGVVLQKAKPPERIKVEELIELFRSYYDEPIPTEELLERSGLQEQRKDWVNQLSGGQEQSLYFALAIAGNPDLLILDEPTRNLDVNANDKFWQQVQDFAQQGKTIIAITHNQSDDEKVAELTTRILTLSNGEIKEQRTPRYFELQHQNIKNSQTSEDKRDWKVLSSQIRFELLDFWRKPVLMGSLLFIAGLAAIIPKDESNQTILVGLAALNILMISIEKFSIRVSTERLQGWVKLLRITPLPPSIYLAAKILVCLGISALVLAIMLGIGAIKLEINQPLLWWLTLFLAIMVSTLPFALLGLGVGYLLSPESISVIIIIVLLLAFMSSGVIPLAGMPERVQDLVAFSPFYHYAQIISSVGDLGINDSYLPIHLEWLVWITSLGCIFVIWAYKRDQVSGS